MTVQTRDVSGALEYFPTLKEATEYANENPGVWKISFSFGKEQERVRLIRIMTGEWVYEPLDIPEVEAV